MRLNTCFFIARINPETMDTDNIFRREGERWELPPSPNKLVIHYFLARSPAIGL
jgi:hypothetical protein